MRFSFMKLTGLLLACICGLATATDPLENCKPSINFFPTAAEIGADPPIQKLVKVLGEDGLPTGTISAEECAGAADCAFPSVWSLSDQQEARTQLGSAYDASLNGMLSVALKEYGSDNYQPVLYFTVSSPLLQNTGNITSCMPPTSRKLLAVPTVTTPANWSYTTTIGTAQPTVGQKVSGKAGKLQLSPGSTAEEECADITVTLTGYSLTGAADLPEELNTTKTVCWFRDNGQAEATIEFVNMCLTNDVKLSANVSSVTPQAQFLRQDGRLVEVGNNPAFLFQPAVQVWGDLNQTLDDTALPEELPSINKYYLLPANTTSATFALEFANEEPPAEGYYNVSAKVSTMTQYPQLVDLQGRSSVKQTVDISGATYTEYMGVTIRNGSDASLAMVGVQRSTTLPTISKISTDKAKTTIEAGDDITFTWQFVAVKHTETCYHDETPLAECKSPMTVVAGEFGNETTQHVFTIVFEDVCGHTKNASYTYSQAGVVQMSNIDYIPVVQMENNTTSSLTKKSAAAINASSFLVTLCLGVLSWVVMALL